MDLQDSPMPDEEQYKEEDEHNQKDEEQEEGQERECQNERGMLLRTRPKAIGLNGKEGYNRKAP